MNIGSVINKGVEFEFDAQVLKAKDFSFEIYGNVSENRDEVLRLAQDCNRSQSLRKMGMVYHELWTKVNIFLAR